MGDFNGVRCESERYGLVFNALHAVVFNNFITNASLFDVPLGGFSFSWSDRITGKMSKLDRFLISEGFFGDFSKDFRCDS